MPLTAIVSTQAGLRDDIWTLVQANVSHNVRFLELEYQLDVLLFLLFNLCKLE